MAIQTWVLTAFSDVSKNRLDPPMLLDPHEAQRQLPAAAMQLGHEQWAQTEIVGEKNEQLAVFDIVELPMLDVPVASLVGIGQRAAGDSAAHTQVVALARMHPQTKFTLHSASLGSSLKIAEIAEIADRSTIFGHSSFGYQPPSLCGGPLMPPAPILPDAEVRLCAVVVTALGTDAHGSCHVGKWNAVVRRRNGAARPSVPPRYADLPVRAAAVGPGLGCSAFPSASWGTTAGEIAGAEVLDGSIVVAAARSVARTPAVPSCPLTGQQ